MGFVCCGRYSRGPPRGAPMTVLSSSSSTQFTRSYFTSAGASTHRAMFTAICAAVCSRGEVNCGPGKRMGRGQQRNAAEAGKLRQEVRGAYPHGDAGEVVGVGILPAQRLTCTHPPSLLAGSKKGDGRGEGEAT